MMMLTTNDDIRNNIVTTMTIEPITRMSYSKMMTVIMMTTKKL